MCCPRVKEVVCDVRNGHITLLRASVSRNAGELGQWWQTFGFAR